MFVYLNFNLVENLSVVDTNNAANHLGNNDHITEMGLDASGLLVLRALKLGLTETLDEGEGLTLKATVEASTGTAVDEVDELDNLENDKYP